MIAKLYAFLVCLLAVLLPWRLRIVLSEILGWMTQAIYLSYYGIFSFILKQLKDEKDV